MGIFGPLKEPGHDAPVDLTNPIFTDLDAARAHFEAIRWPRRPLLPVLRRDGPRGGAGRQVDGAGLVSLQGLPQEVYGGGRHHLRAVAHPADEVALATHLMCASKKA